MNEHISNLSPPIKTLSAVIIGFVLTNNLDAKQQNALANWFLLIGQILETNAGFLQLTNQPTNLSNEDFMETLEKTIAHLQEEITKLKNNFANQKDS